MAYTKKDVMKFWDKDYTCGCGLYVHPNHPKTNSKAIHIKDCMFAPQKGINHMAITKAVIKARMFRAKYPGVLINASLKARDSGSWKENTMYLRTEWQIEVANGNTQLGYWDWVIHKLEASNG